MTIDPEVIKKHIRDSLVDLQNSAKKSANDEEQRGKKVERWLLIGNLVVSGLQLIATLYQIFKA